MNNASYCDCKQQKKSLKEVLEKATALYKEENGNKALFKSVEEEIHEDETIIFCPHCEMFSINQVEMETMRTCMTSLSSSIKCTSLDMTKLVIHSLYS